MREALLERETWWRIAPHIIWPLRFVLPTARACGRPGCCGSACSSTTISAAANCCRGRGHCVSREDPAGAPLKPEFSVGFEYSDCWVEDSRLVVLNARDAADRGATIAAANALRLGRSAEDGVWRVDLRTSRRGR